MELLRFILFFAFGWFTVEVYRELKKPTSSHSAMTSATGIQYGNPEGRKRFMIITWLVALTVVLIVALNT